MKKWQPRSVLPHLSVAAGGTTANVLDLSYQACGCSAEAADPVSARTAVPQDLNFTPVCSTPSSGLPVFHALPEPLNYIPSTASFATSAFIPFRSASSSSMYITATSTTSDPQCYASPAGRVSFASEVSKPLRHVISAPPEAEDCTTWTVEQRMKSDVFGGGLCNLKSFFNFQAIITKFQPEKLFFNGSSAIFLNIHVLTPKML